MTNNNQVNWDEIPEDVEAVLSFTNAEDNYYKEVDSKLYVQTFRTNDYRRSGFSYKDIRNTYGDRFHIRPSPTTKPTPVTPESTQVESSEVEATTPPEFDWSSVEEDVEAVITYKGKCTQLLKTVEGVLKYQRVGELEYTNMMWYSSLDEREKCISHYKDGTATLVRRPPAPTTLEGKIKVGVSSIQTETYTPKPPSISTILQEAQQSILKHHGVTGEVSFTVACSE